MLKYAYFLFYFLLADFTTTAVLQIGIIKITYNRNHGSISLIVKNYLLFLKTKKKIRNPKIKYMYLHVIVISDRSARINLYYGKYVNRYRFRSSITSTDGVYISHRYLYNVIRYGNFFPKEYNYARLTKSIIFILLLFSSYWRFPCSSLKASGTEV